MATALIAGLLVNVSRVAAEGPEDPAPVLLPAGQANGKKVLFDNTHGQTAGAADWVIDGAFSDFGNALAGSGYYVTELRKTTPITYNDLSAYDVFVVGEANIPYKTSEQAAMLQYVQDGGSIFFISDHYNADRNKNRWDSSEAFNGYRRGAWSDPAQGMGTDERNSAAMQDVASSDWLGQNFGVRFRYNAIGDVTADHIVDPSQTFGITSGVQTVAMHAGSTLAILDPEKAKGIVYLPPTTAAWPYAVDQGVYEGGSVDEGPYAAISKVGLGKAAFIGDSSPVEDATPKYVREETGSSKKTYDGFLEQDDAVLLVNIIDWLAEPESYTKLSDVTGLQLDQPTSLLAMENPATSTEPQSEPWAQPAAGYKWWDTCTFKQGSYGYGSGSCGGGGDSGGGSATNDLFISEYVEGGSYNKAIEIYNGTGSTVNLSDYSIALSNITSEIQLSGSLAHGDVLVAAHSNASSAILNVADLTSSNLAFNGDDSVTLKKNGSAVDVIGAAGVSFGTDKTLVRNDTVTSGTTAYNAGEWTAYPKDTFTYLGSHTIIASVLSEDFESGSKGAYANGNVTLASGSWAFNNALIGNLSSDKKAGSQSARIRSAGSIFMNFDVSAAKTVKLSVAGFGSDSGATWKLQQSTNGGSSWTDVTSAALATSALTSHTITINAASAVRFRIEAAGTSGQRINIDNIEILN
ncbi:lamin tail domain-containing protein [Paenibacillus tarimensis]